MSPRCTQRPVLRNASAFRNQHKNKIGCTHNISTIAITQDASMGKFMSTEIEPVTAQQRRRGKQSADYATTYEWAINVSVVEKTDIIERLVINPSFRFV